MKELDGGRHGRVRRLLVTRDARPALCWRARSQEGEATWNPRAVEPPAQLEEVPSPQHREEKEERKEEKNGATILSAETGLPASFEVDGMSSSQPRCTNAGKEEERSGESELDGTSLHLQKQPYLCMCPDRLLVMQ